ncbi:MAG: VWA domain-containing protein [Gammaproteobacteria bacterium]|nr:VWA domain-containing protein [Gammaproteobacteria bacterium]
MEEFVGKVWHRIITRAASKAHEEAAVELSDIKHMVGIMFRALGGDGGLRVEAANATEHGARRSWAERIAGTNTDVELAWRDDETLHLPFRIAHFTDSELNRELYLWLAAMAAVDEPSISSNPKAVLWSQHNQQLVQKTLKRFPGFSPRYQRLVDAVIKLRPEFSSLADDEAELERTIQQALREPGSVTSLPAAKRAPQPVYLWLHPNPPGVAVSKRSAEQDDENGEDEEEGSSQEVDQERRYKAEEVDMPEDDHTGMLGIRFETIFSWSELIKVNRDTDDEEDENAAKVAEDLDHLSVANDGKKSSSRLRFDLDLPSADFDDIRLGSGILLPEWDFKKGVMLPDHCRIQPMLARDSLPCELPQHLRQSARKLRGQFEGLVQTRTWYRGQDDGSEIDMDAYLSFITERSRGQLEQGDGLYREYRPGNRDLASLLLADLSLSTDAAVNNTARVIDVIRDSLYLFSEALDTVGDQFAIYGFSSKKRDHVRLHTLKPFGERYSPEVRGRINAIKPGYYTRMGAAIRYGTELLKKQPATRQLLLILTDGKPNDLDRYEGRYGIEDTREAVREAREAGLYPFCITIDKKASEYLPHLFGPAGYVVIRKPDELPTQLPMLYAQITA